MSMKDFRQSAKQFLNSDSYKLVNNLIREGALNYPESKASEKTVQKKKPAAPKEKMRGGGMVKTAKKKMRGGGMVKTAKKKMRGGGMVKTAKKKMMRG
jgi:hypothetical protein